jgi:hypothetical protein
MENAAVAVFGGGQQQTNESEKILALAFVLVVQLRHHSRFVAKQRRKNYDVIQNCVVTKSASVLTGPLEI